MALIKDENFPCNRCGQCCGANGSPEQRSPWPSNWPNAFRHKTLEQLLAIWPQGLAFGILNKGTGEIGPIQAYGSTRITGPGGRLYYYVWPSLIDENLKLPVCKDTSVVHDGSSYSVECPFLKEWDGSTLTDTGVPERPCALVGTNRESEFTLACDQGLGNTGVPLDMIDDDPFGGKTAQEKVDIWFQRHPACSLRWVKQVI